jgi:uncharacterized protein
MEQSSRSNTKHFFKSACIFEASLLLVAIFLGWVADIDPFEKLFFSESAIGYGVLGTLPLLLLYQSMQYSSLKSIRMIRNILMETLASRLFGLLWSDLLILSVIAGVTEEVLFRGVIQPWLEQSWGMFAGLLGSSLVFGLVHAVTPMYAMLAALVSVYLGLSLDYGETRNLLTPIIIHGLYDFFAFLMIIRTYKEQNLK